MSDPAFTSDSTPAARPEPSLAPGPVGTFLLVLAACGLVTVIANLLGFGGRWLIPEVADLPGLMTSTLILGLLACTPIAFRLATGGRKPPPAPKGS